MEDSAALYELESILHSLVANDTTILDALTQMLSTIQQMQARAEESQNALRQEVRELRGEIRTLTVALAEGGAAARPRAIVHVADPFAAQNPEVALLAYLRPLLADTNAIDVGAHHGVVAERLLRAGYSVYAFEPYAPSFQSLCERLGGNTNFHAFEYALGPADAQAELHVAADLSSVSKWDPTLFNSLVARPMLQDLQFTRTVQVQMRSIESLVSSGELPESAGLLKVDAEGFDLEVLRGIGKSRFSIVMAEFWDAAHAFGSGGHGQLQPLVEEMRRRGYRHYIVVYHLDENETISYYCNRDDTVPESWGNVLFFNEREIFVRALRWCEDVLPATLHR